MAICNSALGGIMGYSLVHAADQAHCIYGSAGIFKSVDDEKLDERVRVSVRGQEMLAFVSLVTPIELIWETRPDGGLTWPSFEVITYDR